jgi:hypothetical protein
VSAPRQKAWRLRPSELGVGGRTVPWLPGVRCVAAQAARALVVALLSYVWATAGQVTAQGARPWERPTWQLGAYDRGVGPTWYWRYQQDGTHPVVETVPPGLGWGLCPGPADAAQQCIVSVQGPWAVIVVDGQTLAERGRVYLPGVSR